MLAVVGSRYNVPDQPRPHLQQNRRVSLAGITRHPDQAWMQQMARNATGEEGIPGAAAIRPA